MLRIEGIFKVYAGLEACFPAIVNLSLHVARGQRLALIGPSGCGKTTLLRCIAGLEAPNAGRISIEPDVVFDSSAGVDVPPWQRRVGMVFQSLALWSHMTVLENVMFPLRSGAFKISKPAAAARARAALSLVELELLKSRYPAELSGGQQQRVALARALVSEPELLLMDEPLSSLDQVLRKRTREELVEILDRACITTVFVTHDREDGFTMAHEIALMSGGQVLQRGTPRGVYESSICLEAAATMGPGRSVSCSMVREGDTCHFRFPDSEQSVQMKRSVCGEGAVLFFRPESCEVLSCSEGLKKASSLRGKLRAIRFAGAHDSCVVSVDGSLVEGYASRPHKLCVGDDVMVKVDSNLLQVFR